MRRVQQQFAAQEHSGLLVVNNKNIAYLTGLRPLSVSDREAMLLVTREHAILLLSALREFANHGTLDWLVVRKTANLPQVLRKTIKALRMRSLALEPESLRLSEFRMLEAIHPLSLTDRQPIIERLRMIKEPEEIRSVNEACRIASRVLVKVKTMLTPGITERELAGRITALLIEEGADGVPEGFTPVVAFAQHSAVPHHVPTAQRLRRHDIVLLDFGCEFRGYVSDITRTISIGSPPPGVKEGMRVIRTAHRLALAALGRSRVAKEVDAAARDHITKSGLGKYFIHGTGHGVGLSIHEAPAISPGSRDVLKPGMVFTIEPGVYLEGQFGIRHEDTVLLTAKGPLVLTVGKPNTRAC